MTDEEAAEKIIRDWIHRNCNPSPYGVEENFRRVVEEVNRVWRVFADAFQEAWTSWPPNMDEEWELTR